MDCLIQEGETHYFLYMLLTVWDIVALLQLAHKTSWEAVLNLKRVTCLMSRDCGTWS